MKEIFVVLDMEKKVDRYFPFLYLKKEADNLATYSDWMALAGSETFNLSKFGKEVVLVFSDTKVKVSESNG